MTNGEYKAKLDQILDQAIEKDATDVHLSINQAPLFRIDGKLTDGAESKKEKISIESTKIV